MEYFSTLSPDLFLHFLSSRLACPTLCLNLYLTITGVSELIWTKQTSSPVFAPSDVFLVWSAHFSLWYPPTEVRKLTQVGCHPSSSLCVPSVGSPFIPAFLTCLNLCASLHVHLALSVQCKLPSLSVVLSWRVSSFHLSSLKFITELPESSSEKTNQVLTSFT